MHTIVQKTTSNRPRIAIVGAGISGLVLASLLSDVNANVVVLRQDMVPARARCYPGLFDRADLRALGVELSEADARPIEAVHRSIGNASPSEADTVPVDVVAIEHGSVLDALERKVTARGVQVVDGFMASQLLLTDGVVSGVLDEGRGKTIEADVVVLADESDPRLAERIGLRPDWLPTEIMHLCKERYPASADVIAERLRSEGGSYRAVSHRFQSSWGGWGTGMIVPGPTGVTVQVSMLLEDEMASARHITEYLDEFRAIPAVAAMLEDLRAERFFTEVVPIGGFDKPRPFHADGVLVVSDLLGVTHPLNRDGLSTNLKACAAAAIALSNAVRENDFDARTLSRYSRQLDAEVIRPIRTERRRTFALRARPAWEWASMPSLLPALEGVTTEPISETLPAAARRKALDGLSVLGRRVGIRPGSRVVIDE